MTFQQDKILFIMYDIKSLLFIPALVLQECLELYIQHVYRKLHHTVECLHALSKPGEALYIQSLRKVIME